jgi:hypothetical protein
MSDADTNRFVNEPRNKVLSTKDLVEALLIKIEGGRSDDYWSTRVQLLAEELGYLRPFEPERGLRFESSLDLLVSQMKLWELPYEGALEVPASPDFFSQSWAQENFATEIAKIKSEIRRIHHEIFTKFFELWRDQLEISGEKTTVEKLLERGLSPSEPVDESWIDDL